jgi:regulatory protein
VAADPKSSGSAPNPQTARAAALALVARRDYTTAEIAARLRERGFDAEAIASALTDLRATRALDDARVAATHARRAAAIKGRGRVRIARELAARGLPPAAIEDALAGVAAGDELASIRRILVRKRWPDRPTLADRQRMFRHLLRRGFPADLISRALGGRRDDDPGDDA